MLLGSLIEYHPLDPEIELREFKISQLLSITAQSTAHRSLGDEDSPRTKYPTCYMF